MPPPLEPFVDRLPLPPILDPVEIGPDGTPYYSVPMLPGKVKLHRDLCETPIWGYGGVYPGPTIEVPSDRPVVVEYVNRLSGPFPYVRVAADPTDQVPYPQESPGRGGVSPTPLPDLRWTVVHLHGSPSRSESDGWPDNAFLPGQSVTYTYPPQGRATLLWYHDHANMITRLNVYAGLAGLFVARDPAEQDLRLPCGPPYEIPLLLQDRNLDVDPAKDAFTGHLLYKLADINGEFYGPYPLVNGKLFPYVDAEPAQYRLRILNGSNARFFRLRLKVGHKTFSTAEFTQIGVDGGFLPGPRPIPADGLTLAPAERADVILDLRPYAGRNVTLYNDATTALAPVPPKPDNVERCPVYHEILQFRVAGHPGGAPVIHLPPSIPSPDLPTADQAVRRRPVALIEDPPGTLLLNGKPFHDMVDDTPELDTVEIWEFFNTTGDVHPMHIHLVDFRVWQREAFTLDLNAHDFHVKYLEWYNQDPATRPRVPPGIKLSGKPLDPDPNEGGPKDTVRAPGGQVTRVVARFGPHTGQYVYHCHILEHEDHEMMRPYLVVPPGLMDMGMGQMPMPAAPKDRARPMPKM